MTTEFQEKSSNLRSNIALIMTIFSGIGSFGSLLLNWLDSSGLSETTFLWFQGFAALTILLAVIFIGMEWDLRRNKWFGIEDRYMQMDFLTSVTNPEYTPDIFYRMRIELLRKRKRLALSEGNIDLANQYQSEIDEAEKHLKKSD
jgi:hypothetical protein